MSNENKKRVSVTNLLKEHGVEYDELGRLKDITMNVTSEVYGNMLMTLRNEETVTPVPKYRVVSAVINKKIAAKSYAKSYTGYPNIDRTKGIMDKYTMDDWNGEKIEKTEEIWRVYFDPKKGDTERINKMILDDNVVDAMNTKKASKELLTQDSILISNEFERELEFKIFRKLSNTKGAFEKVFKTEDIKSQEDYVKGVKKLLGSLNTAQEKTIVLDTIHGEQNWLIKTNYNPSDFVMIRDINREADLAVDLG